MYQQQDRKIKILHVIARFINIQYTYHIPPYRPPSHLKNKQKQNNIIIETLVLFLCLPLCILFLVFFSSCFYCKFCKPTRWVDSLSNNFYLHIYWLIVTCFYIHYKICLNRTKALFARKLSLKTLFTVGSR